MLDKATFLDFVVEVVRRTDGPGVQGAAAALGGRAQLRLAYRYRRLVRDYEARLDVSEAMIYAAMGNMLVRKSATDSFQTNYRESFEMFHISTSY